MDGLTDRQRRFVQEYLVDFVGSAAYQRAGYKSKSPEVEASKLLRNPKVAKAISGAQKRVQKRLEWTAEDIMRGIQEIAEDREAKDSDRLRAYELGGKRLGIWIDTHKVDMTVKTFEQQLEEIED